MTGTPLASNRKRYLPSLSNMGLSMTVSCSTTWFGLVKVTLNFAGQVGRFEELERSKDRRLATP
jgi:hypothetical protein